MRCIVLYILTCLSFLFSSAQTQGFAYDFNGISTYANLGDVLKTTKTIEFWIKPNNPINTSSSIQPILVRDGDGMSFIGNEEFALFFDGSTGTNPGHLTYRVGDGTNSATITSDTNQWSAGVWYHVAVSLTPGQGLKMYVNGNIQSSTSSSVSSIYFRSEGPSGDLLLGRWDNAENDYLDAQLDNLRFWNSARSQNQIRSTMCHEILTGPSFTFTFNTKLSNTLIVLGGVMNPILVNGNTSHYKTSTAPFGLSSVNLYNTDLFGQELSMDGQYDIKIDSMLTPANGVHIYSFIDPRYPLGVLNRGQFGVWFNEQQATYNVSFNYDSLSVSCDSCFKLASRDDNSSNNWTDRSVIKQGCTAKLVGESSIGKSYREEYNLNDTIVIETGLGDTAVFCSDDFKFIVPNNYPGATYIWNDTNYVKDLMVTDTGYQHLELRWNGCKVSKDVYVEVYETPQFYLPPDTTICEGDTLWLTAPIDSAEYLWVGFFTQRTFGITSPGTYNLKIKVGDCFAVDEIKVDVIRNFNVDLGPDTNLCLGEGINFAFSGNGINYEWSDGSTSPFRQIFNQPGQYWVRAYNSCFEKFDTVNINYEECDCNIFVANSFSPNGDGENEIFKAISGCYYEEFEFEILNRWGGIIYKSNHLEDGWDGTINGKQAPMGMYNWRLRYKKFSWQKLSNYDYGQLILIR